MASSTGRPKYSKPRVDFPLFPHQTGRWAKKVKGKMLYFGRCADDPFGEKALATWNAERDHSLQHGQRKPRESEALTIKELCNRVLNFKRRQVDDGDITHHTLAAWLKTCAMVVSQFSGNRIVQELSPNDFDALYRQHIAGRAATSRATAINFVKALFRFAYNDEQRLIPAPVLFGVTFKPPKLPRGRLDPNRDKTKEFSPEELRRIIDFVRRPMKAIILLGINCGFGNHDCASLTFSGLDLDGGWHNHTRPKTGVFRRCPLWPETVAAIRHGLENRPKPKDPAHKDLVFLTRNGLPYTRLSASSVVALEKDDVRSIMATDTVGTNFWAALKRLSMKRGGLSFYALRRLTETIGGRAKDQAALDYIMGHTTPGMGTQYRLDIEDSRLRAVTDCIHDWLFSAGVSTK